MIDHNRLDSSKYSIIVNELTKEFAGVCAVDHLEFCIRSKSIFGLLGPNGAGKSTTVKMLTTLLAPTCGSATICGYDIVTQGDRVRENIGYVSQMLSADGDLTGYENLLLSAKLYDIQKRERDKRIHQALEFMGLTHVGSQLVRGYSGGMIRRLEIAQALLHQPLVLILDEPTVGLDPSAKKVVWDHIKEWRKAFGTTVLMTTHDMTEADKLCDEIAILYFGKIVAFDTPDKLKNGVGGEATLEDVFIHHTGSKIMEGGNYAQVKATRNTISHLE